jgi:hypothetical protein
MAKKDDPEKKKPGQKPAPVPNPGLPDKERVISERTLVSPKGKRYRIIRTSERDPYDPSDEADKKDS